MILTSLLDTDHYKITMDQVIFFHFPEAFVRYEFFNRGKTSFPDGFAARLRAEVYALSEFASSQMKSPGSAHASVT